jgi:cbb3-type cytochrome c oxidase subunit III
MAELQEGEVLHGHEYDGIQELDNDLPRWWLFGFYFTIVFGVVYWIYYHMSSLGPSPEQEFLREMADAGYRVPSAALQGVTEQDLLLGVVGVLCAIGALIFAELLRADRSDS